MQMPWAFRREVLTKRYRSPVLTVQSEWRVLPAVANYSSVEEVALPPETSNERAPGSRKSLSD
jgi:hypothetical protein